jgi:F-type H+-transporting ATPase subunit delta
LIGSEISKRYAKAFFELAGEENKYEVYHEDLSRFSTVLDSSKDLKEFFANPVFNHVEKKQIMEYLLGRIELSPLTANFLGLLVDKGRIGLLDEIVASYRDMMDKTLQRVQVSVRTAYALTPVQQASLLKQLEEMTKKKADMSVMEDPSLLAGIVVRVGDTVYDGSVRTQLNNIRNLLGEEI